MEMTEDLQKQLNNDIRSLEQNLLKFDSIFNSMEYKRNVALEKAEEFIDKLKCTGMEDADTLSAKMSVLTTYNKIITDQENNANRRVMMSLRNKELDIGSNQIGELITGILNSVDLSKFHKGDAGAINMSNANDLIDAKFQEMGLEIKPGELKTDETDLD